MKKKSKFQTIGKMEIEWRDNTVVSIRYKNKFLCIGDFVIAQKRVRGFQEGTRGIIIEFSHTPKSVQEKFIEVHFESQPRAYTMSLREIKGA